ncbi:Smr/MutS family protein [Maritimibacter alexandrii]|uniref:Smr/MutS family protein n=1 Tax=Maritimibacter alexandrii TaxID=2570355 RepID=UPI0011096EAE|nr:Smr/MutS family protein [Maritimibacter alexandrii]
MARRPRHLSADEKALWDEVAKRATPMHPTRTQETASEALVSKPKPAPPSPDIKPFRIGTRSDTKLPSNDLAPKVEDSVARAPVAMDRKRYQQMKRGKLSPEARIDLHGLTMAQAHPRLLAFIMNSVAEGRRFVLVITGKGKSRPDDGPIPERHGVLRHQVPHWLNSPPLRSHVLQISEANRKHGGLGAYYVYLRRPR